MVGCERGTVSDMTMNEALAHVLLAETMTWLQEVRATVRFFDHEDGPRVRVAVRTDPAVPDDFTAVLVPVADSTPESLAISLSAAREQIEPHMVRRSLRLVPQD